MQTILVATDLSPRSERALRRGLRLARGFGARLHVASVVDDAMSKGVRDTACERSREELARFLDDNGADVAWQLDVTTGEPAATILAKVDALAPDLLVIGSHRHRRFLDFVRETTGERILRNARCPVLVARDPDDHDYASVLVGTDFSPAAAAAIRVGVALAPGGTVTPLHTLQIPHAGLMGPSAEASEALISATRAEAEALDADWRAAHDLPAATLATVTVTGTPFVSLTRVVERDGIDLLACGAHGRAGAARALLGSLANDLVRDPPCDVVIARP